MVKFKMALVAGMVVALSVACTEQVADEPTGDEGVAAETMAPGSEAPEQASSDHSEEHLNSLQEQCMRQKNSEAFCTCGIAAVKDHTSGEHFMTHDEGFVGLGEVPEDVSKKFQEAVLACEAEHITEEAAADVPHKDEHIAKFKEQCMAEKDNEEFCDCGVSAIVEHLPGQHVNVNNEGTVAISAHTPSGTSQTVQEAIAACEAEHLGAADAS